MFNTVTFNTVMFNPKRRGFQLTEILMAIAMAAGPMLAAIVLINQNVTGARFNVDQATARQALVDLTELLLGETMDSLRDTAKPGKNPKLNDLLKNRIGRLPEAAQKQYNQQVAGLADKFECSLSEDVGGVKGLAKLTLSVVVGKSTVKVSRYFRPEARLKPATTAPPATQQLN